MGCRWVPPKQDVSGVVVTYGTARLVGNGFTQIENVDFVYAPSRCASARLFWALVAPERLSPRPEDWNDELDGF